MGAIAGVAGVAEYAPLFGTTARANPSFGNFIRSGNYEFCRALFGPVFVEVDGSRRVAQLVTFAVRVFAVPFSRCSGFVLRSQQKNLRFARDFDRQGTKSEWRYL